MNSQKEIFKSTEGNQWFHRNNKSYDCIQDKTSQIVNILQSIELIPKKVLEIGCSNGALLDSINKVFHAKCYGIDPSGEAIEDGKSKFPNIALQVGTADSLPFKDGSFDIIIFGFCLYLCDRKDLFKIAYEADRCLLDKGSLIIKDFYPPFPYKNKYVHFEGIYSYKMDYTKMFKWNPSYKEVSVTVFSHAGFSLRDLPDEKVAISILRKNEQSAYPPEPFKT